MLKTMNNHKNKSVFSLTEEDAEKRFEYFKDKDPFPGIMPALLNSADITDYVAYTGMIFPFNYDKLGPASYEMVLGGECLYWDENEKKVNSKNVKEGEKIVLRKNSITYVSTLESFRIPYYIALRFNFRVKHVHRGLLLGTGPLIDPGFCGKLMIPIHNLTNNDYFMKGGEELISVEFTKISPNALWQKKVGVIERRGCYIENSKKNSQKTFEELIKKVLPFGVGKVMSSLAGTLAEASQQIRKIRWIKNIAYLSTAAVLIALVGLFYYTIQVVSDANKYVSDAALIVKKKNFEDLDMRNFVARDEVNVLRNEVRELADEISKLRAEQNINGKIDGLTNQIIFVKDEVEAMKAAQPKNENK